MNAIIVCVDYWDYLSITLPINIRYFNNVTIVTDFNDYDLHFKYLENLIKHYNKINIIVTDTFYDDGAIFNKWKALEFGLDSVGREGWICHLDADIVWPITDAYGLKIETYKDVITIEGNEGFYKYEKGDLITPLRRMLHDFNGNLPEEKDWIKHRIHRNLNEWAGYSQIFHAEDPVLPNPPPWHQIDWEHAGGADSFFQNMWSRENKYRPPFDCLHLGDAGKNWYGRATKYLNGKMPKDAQEKLNRCADIWRNRRARKARGLDPYQDEKI